MLVVLILLISFDPVLLLLETAVESATLPTPLPRRILKTKAQEFCTCVCMCV